MSLKPFFTYYGGKWRAAPRYPKPEYRTIIEPFAGSAGYSLRYPDRKIILVEKDPVVAATWRYLLRVSSQEILSLPDIHPGQTVKDLDVCPEARLLIGWWLNKGASSPCQSPSSWMRSGIRPHSYWGDTIRHRIASQLEYIRHWTLIGGNYEDAPEIEATWFIDPPYIDAGVHYQEGSGGIDYTALGLWCLGRKGQIMVCENSGATWLPFQPFLNIKASPAKYGGKISQEALWVRVEPDVFSIVETL